MNSWNSNFTEETLINLSETLQRLDCLRSIDVSFAYNQLITDQGVNKFSEALQRLSRLKSLNLNLYGQESFGILVY